MHDLLILDNIPQGSVSNLDKETKIFLKQS